jgi:ubiquinone/menaquinone biosynthesis C-methylase UbiE
MKKYDITADIYDTRYAEEQAAKYKVTLGNLRRDKLGLVLDVGCGTGLLFDYIADKSKMVVGLDISRKTLLVAWKRKQVHDNVHLILADADNIPLINGTFDHIFAMTVIQNSPDPAKTLKEIKRSAEDSAEVIVSGLKRIFPKERFRKLLKHSGFRIASLKDEDNLRCYVAVCTKLQR